MTPQRHAEITRFHHTLATTLETNPAALTRFERRIVVQLMGELLDHVAETI